VNEGARPWWQMGLDDRLKRANRRTHSDLLHEVCGLPPTGAPPQFVVPASTRRAIHDWFTPLVAPFERIVLLNTGWELDLYGRGEVVTADVPCLACYRPECDQAVTCMDLLAPETIYAASVRVRANQGAPTISSAR
jgi:hypothetical protein